MEPDYQAYAAQFNPIGDMAADAKGLAVSRELAAQQLGGQQIANGDYSGASKTLYSAGDLPGGQTAMLQGGQIGQAKAIARRDYAGAAIAAGNVGDVAGVKDAQATGIQQFQLQHQYLQQLTPILQAANQKAGADGLTHAIDTVTPELTQLGVDPKQIAQYRQAAMSDPNGFLTGITALAAPLKWQQVGEDLVAFNAAGQPVRRFASSKTVTLNNPNGSQSVVQTPGGLQDLGGGAAPVANAGTPAAGTGLAHAIFGRESGGDPNAPPSVDGARGQAQILPSTFAQYAKPGERIDNPADNAAVGQRIVADLTQKYGGDPARVAVGYFSGPDNVAPAGSPTPWKQDLKDGNGQSVSGYVGGIMSRLGGSPAPAATAGGAQVLATSGDGSPAFREATPDENRRYGNPDGTGQFDAKGEYKPIKNSGEIDNLNNDDVDRLARSWLVDKSKLDGRSQAVIQRVQKYATDLDAAAGITPEQRSAIQSTVKGTETALGDISKLEATVGAYEKTANANAERVLTLLDKGGSDHPTPLGAHVQQMLRRASGDTDVASLDGALKDFNGEFAKVMFGSGTGAGGSGGVGERESNDEFFSSSVPKAVLKARLEQARAGMAQRTAQLASERARLQGIISHANDTGGADLGGGPTTLAPPVVPAAQPPSPQGSSFIQYDASGKRIQ